MLPVDRATHILETALWRFTLQGLHATTTDDIVTHSNLSVGTLFRTFPSKEALLEATYAYAVAHLAAPLQDGVGDPQRNEYLRGLLKRWWLLTAQAALAKPEAFDLWRLYRTQPRAAAASEPLLGPFAPVPALVERALARNTWPQSKAVPVSVLVASLAGQWTAAVDLVLTDAACRADAALTTQVLTQTYAGWWQSLDWHKFVEADWRSAVTAPMPKPKPKPQPQPNALLTAFAKALETHLGAPAPQPGSRPLTGGAKGTLLPKPGAEPSESSGGS